MLTSTRVIRAFVQCEDQPIVFMLKFWNDIVENALDVSYSKYILHVDVNQELSGFLILQHLLASNTISHFALSSHQSLSERIQH